ncbi:hypothetical protein EQF91_03680 [Helcococcus ovis]|uniref:Uncharacterized protein n=1 Tax=Helcococcus ovis TaxID=72026 RepID=A0A4R9C4K0_9FIRM|nr:hypothetical protein [Helcococcus ovis]TFF64146.1 hypothetical protein EQF92_06950 [Helcococcus ovis]TFF66562.1 hypothetical protein EQF91_03680 [Helcococcus ovis]
MIVKRLKKIISFIMAIMIFFYSGFTYVNAENEFTAKDLVEGFANDFSIVFEPKSMTEKIEDVTVNNKKMRQASSSISVWGTDAYFVDKENGKLYLSEPKSDSEIIIKLNDGSTKKLQFTKNGGKGNRISVVSDSTQTSQIHKEKSSNEKKEDSKELKATKTQSQVKVSKDSKLQSERDFSLGDFKNGFGEVTVNITPKEFAGKISKIHIGYKEYTKSENKYRIWGGGDKYYVDKDTGKIYFIKLEDKFEIKIKLNDGTEKKFILDKNKNKFDEVKDFKLKDTDLTKTVPLKVEKVEKKEVRLQEKNKENLTAKSSSLPVKSNQDAMDFTDKHETIDFMLVPKGSTKYNISELKVNHIPYELKTNKLQTFYGGYYVDKDGIIHMNEPRDGALITIIDSENNSHYFKYDKSKQKGSRISIEKDPETIKEKKLKIRLVGEFEPAVVQQEKYDAISGATTGTISNQNSNAKIQFAEVSDTNQQVKESDWKDLHTNPWSLRSNQVKLELNKESGMKAKYNHLDSSVTLNGTPKKPGKYNVKAVVMHNGNKIESEPLLFEVYSQNEKLVDHLKLENAKKMQDGKYIYTLKPWLIQEFNGSDEIVTVPKEIKAIYGSHKSGTYGVLGKYSNEGTKQTLILDSDTNLTLVNMKVKSSVKIVVKKGAKLNLIDSSIYGIIDVEDGGTFSMNFDYQNGKFVTGTSINGKVILENGSNITNSMIYSNTNFLTDAGVNGRANKNVSSVLEVRGNVNLLGNVFIRGDEAPTGIDPETGRVYAGQSALMIKNGKLNIVSGATLAAYGGGKIATTTNGGSAIILDNGQITGEGSLIAVGGTGFSGNGGDAISGNGKISVKSAILQGGNTYSKSSVAGKGHSDNVIISSETIGKAIDGKYILRMSDYDQPLYWQEIIFAPNISSVDFGNEFINKNKKVTEKVDDEKIDSKKITEKIDSKKVNKKLPQKFKKLNYL